MKVLVFLAEGFEEVEALTVVDYLRRLDSVEVDMVSITNNEYVKGAHGIIVKADKTLINLKNISSYNCAVIPGGMPGATNLRDEEKVIDILKQLNQDKKLIAAICAGPIVLERAGLLENKKVTSYPGFESEFSNSIYLEEKVVIDENIITSRGPAIAVDFALAIAEKLVGERRAKDLKLDILYLE